jgi:hypothetical protein
MSPAVALLNGLSSKPAVPATRPAAAATAAPPPQVDPQVGAGALRFPEAVKGAKVTAKVENDVHCEWGFSVGLRGCLPHDWGPNWFRLIVWLP